MFMQTANKRVVVVCHTFVGIKVEKVLVFPELKESKLILYTTRVSRQLYFSLWLDLFLAVVSNFRTNA